MSVDLHFEMKKGYLYVQVTGDFSLQETLRAFDEILEAAARHNTTLILIDELAYLGTPDTYELFFLGEYIAEALNRAQEARQRQRLRVAFVAREPLRDRDFFGEIVATNRGASVWSFDTVPDAERWLFAGSRTLPRGAKSPRSRMLSR